MLEENNRPLRFKRKGTKKQQMWGYMRRNRSFRVGDVMAVLELSMSFCKQTLWYLSECGYVRLENDAKRYEDRIYTLVNDTGVKAPSMIDNKLYDYNTGKEYEVKRTVTDPITIAPQILETLKSGAKSQAEIARELGISTSAINRNIQKLISSGVVHQSKNKKYERCGQ